MKRVGFDVKELVSERTKTVRMEDRQKIQYDIIGIHKVKSIICVSMSVIIKAETVRHRLKHNALFSNYYSKRKG